MLSLIAWRNIWRNKVRSLVVIASVILGVWGGTFIMAFSYGLGEEFVRTGINDQVSHIQIHNPEYRKDHQVKYTIPQADSIEKEIAKLPGVKAVCARTLVNGMISSANSGTGVNINGINAVDEDSVTHLANKIISGDYFSGVKHNPVILSERMANKLGVKLGNKIVLMFQDAQENITAGAFRISGIYRTRSTPFDDVNVFVKADDLNRILRLEDPSHEIAVLLKSNDDLFTIQDEIKKIAPAVLVENWQELAPDLKLIIGSLQQKIFIFISIILLALGFGIVNTMLMAVLERVHELGMLMAIGMNKLRVFFMIMLETILLSLAGGPIGVLIAFVSNSLLHKTGINLSMFSKGFQMYGMNPIVHPALPAESYLTILIMILITALLAAIYPSIKAVQLKPVQAIQKI